MRKIFLAALVFAVMCAAPVFADTDTTGSEANENIIPAASAEQLLEILKGGPGANGPVTVRLEEGVTVENYIDVPQNVTLDLNGQTVNGGVSLEGDGASVINGIINEGEVSVMTEDPTGTISNMTINDAPSEAIYICSGSIGDIKDNTINNSGYHGIRLEKDASAGDITGNTLTGCKGDGISVYFGSHCGAISYNTLTNTGGHDTGGNGDFAITVNGSDSQKSYAEEITHNEIDGITYAGIVVYGGSKKSGSGCGGELAGDIAYNTVKNAATYTKNKECEAAIYVDSHAVVKGDIHDNIVEASRDDGISVIIYSSVRSIFNNTVKGSYHAGIGVKNYSNVTGNISGNKVISSKEDGIFINSSSKVKGLISSNTITKAKGNGIFVSNSARANIVKKNTVTNAGLYAVIAGGKGRINQVTGNTLSVNNARKGLVILCNKKCLITKITGNKITGKFNAGIRIISPAGKVTVKSNKITSSNPKGKRSVGISTTSAKKKVKISGNKIKKCKPKTSIK